jgi:hypothetical protein
VRTDRPVRRLLTIALFGCASMTLLSPIARADDDPLNALMMGGTGMPTPSEFWQDTIVTDYIDPATGENYTPVMVPTPETLASTTVPVGLADLQAVMAEQPAGQPYLVEGYSQSADIVVALKNELLQTGQHPDVTLLMLGDPARPNGGLDERFVGMFTPGLGMGDLTGAEPTDAGIPTIDIANQYDFVADYPQFPIDPVSDLNAIFGLIYGHAAYGDGPLPEEVPALWPPSEPLSGPFASEYTLGSTEIVKQVDGDTTFYFIPTTELPLLDPLRSLGVPESVLNIFQPALQVIVEAGYDRSIPFGDPTPAELIPTIDPVTFTLELDNGIVQGANNAFELFDSQLPDYAQIESMFASAESWSEQDIGVPYDQVVTELNNAFDPYTIYDQLDGTIGQDIENLLVDTGIQQDVLDPILSLIGPFCALFTS